MSEWKVYNLGEIASVQTGPFGSQLHQSDYVEVGTPIITVEHLGENRILHKNLPRVNDEDKNRLKKYWLQEDDIVFSRVGSVDRRAYVKKNEDGWLFSGRCLRVRPSKKVDGKFLSYFFGMEDFKSKIRAVAVGATMPSLNSSIMNDIEVTMPEDLDTQQEIAQILTSLDDKIELNHKMNHTLEAMAQALFKEWFVDFNFPGFDGELVDGLPKGWRKGRTDDLFILQRGFDLPAITRTEGLYPVVAASGISTYHHEYKVKGPGVTTGRSGVLGKVYFITEDFWPLNTSLFIKEYKNSTPLFAYHILKGMNLLQLNGGSAVPTLNRNDVHGIECIIPNIEVINLFESIAKSLYQKIFENSLQIQTLTQARDTLLPKLMSGKLEIRE
jgi:type I restriction enzyme, S subunit